MRLLDNLTQSSRPQCLLEMVGDWRRSLTTLMGVSALQHTFAFPAQRWASDAPVVTVPSINFTRHGGDLDLSTLTTIAVDPRYADWRDDTGETLIPPSLYEFAQTFAFDLSSAHDVHLAVVNDSSASNAIFLTIDGSSNDYLDAAGRPTAEGYTLNVTEGGVTISGASSLGAWWGSRTLLQLAALGSQGRQTPLIPTGTAADAPGWSTRGFMLDAARHYYPPSFLTEMCAYLSYFKQNTLHLHLSDNLVSAIIDDRSFVDSLYSAFRLRSDDPSVAGLASPANESYTREVFDDIQRQCAARGVTIIPEIEAPGHALPLTKWKPELALGTDATMLNISVPETIPTMKALWDVFLPWMHSKSVHLGADEYNSSFVEDYNRLVNELNGHIGTVSGKNVRIWGTFPPKPTYSNNIPTNVTIQHWEFFEDNPLFDYLDNNYTVINSDDGFYIVNKFSESYPQHLNKTRIFYGAPGGFPYAPNIFDTKNATNNPPRDQGGIPGELAALWNDYGPNATVYSEAYFALRDNLPALADKQWGGSLTEDQYDSVFATLHAAIPAQNLDMDIPSQGSVVLQYRFADGKQTSDGSGNGYDPTNNGCIVSDSTVTFDGVCSLSTPLERKGRNYTLSADVYPSAEGGSLFANSDSALLLGTGDSSNVTMMADGQHFSLNYTLPTGKWSRVALIADGNHTFLSVDSGERQEFTTRIGIAGTHYAWAPMAFPAPLSTLGQGFKGMMRNVTLVDYVDNA